MTQSEETAGKTRFRIFCEVYFVLELIDRDNINVSYIVVLLQKLKKKASADDVQVGGDYEVTGVWVRSSSEYKFRDGNESNRISTRKPERCLINYHPCTTLGNISYSEKFTLFPK